MRKKIKILVLGLLMMFILVGSIPVQALNAHPLDAANVTLTEKQQKVLASQYKDILKREKKVIATYVKYGVITEEQGKIISAHLDKRYEKLQENGFIPQWGKHHKKLERSENDKAQTKEPMKEQMKEPMKDQMKEKVKELEKGIDKDSNKNKER